MNPACRNRCPATVQQAKLWRQDVDDLARTSAETLGCRNRELKG
jgi:hypothetical protein